MENTFDTIVERRGSFSLKWDGMTERYGFDSESVLPMWLADMDFLSPSPIKEALEKRVQHGIYGYGGDYNLFKTRIVDWIHEQQGIVIDPEWVVYAQGVITGINVLLTTIIKEGDEIIVQPPVYPPLLSAGASHGAVLVENPLACTGDRYSFDLEDLKEKITNKTKVLLLCSPHNPVGRVWRVEELRTLCDICKAHGILIIADEIYSDLILGENKFTSCIALGEYLPQIVVSCSPSKAFNIPGLETSYLIIPDEEMRNAFLKKRDSLGLKRVNIFGQIALQTAYGEGKPWLTEMLGYLDENLLFIEDYFQKNLPQLKIIRPEGTFLLWIDCRAAIEGLKSEETASSTLLKNADLFVNSGESFGEGGEGHIRLNYACPRAVLEDGLNRIRTVFGKSSL